MIIDIPVVLGFLVGIDLDTMLRYHHERLGNIGTIAP
jgi:hypothetical protein